MKQQHVQQVIPDYVLGLLTRNEEQQVDQHALTCPDCRLALRREQEFSQLVHTTLHAAARPPANLRLLMPPVLQKTKRAPLFIFSLNWQRQLVPLTVALFMLLGSLGFYLSEQRGFGLYPTPTSLAITATQTELPTATITETRAEEIDGLTITAVPEQSTQPAVVTTPSPNPTPIAALGVMHDT